MFLFFLLFKGRQCWRAREVAFIGRGNDYSSLTASNSKGKDWTLRGERPEM